jgi:2-polyprenyl-3-methyl-5-hydroxy-6-metoxy-1,4-benzoquinol methylase
MSKEVKEYEASEFWNKRYKRCDLTTSGHIDLPFDYNYWMYELKKNKVRKSVLRYLSPSQLAEARIMDLGCGTGIYVDMWKNQGVQQLVGLDISSVAVDLLNEKYKGYSFYTEDLADPALPSKYGAESYDVVTAIGVLVHILDDKAFSSALKNMVDMLADDGIIILVEYLRKGPAQEGSYMKVRSFPWYKQELKKVGLELLEQKPVYFFMGRPYDVNGRLANYFFNTAFRWNRALIRRFPKFMGAVLYAFDSFVTRFMKDGPSEEILVCKKASKS